MKRSRNKNMNRVMVPLVVTLFSCPFALAGQDDPHQASQGQPHWQTRMPLPPVAPVQQAPQQQAPVQTPFDPFVQVRQEQNQQPYPLPPLQQQNPAQQQGQGPFDPFALLVTEAYRGLPPALQPTHLQNPFQMNQQQVIPVQQAPVPVQDQYYSAQNNYPQELPSAPISQVPMQQAYPGLQPPQMMPSQEFIQQPYQGLQPPMQSSYPGLQTPAPVQIVVQPVTIPVSAIPVYQNPFGGAEETRTHQHPSLDERLELQVAAAELIRLHKMGQAEPYSKEQLHRFEHIAKQPGYQAQRPMNDDDLDAVATSSAVLRLRHLSTSRHLERGLDSDLKFSANYFSEVLYNLGDDEARIRYIRESFHSLPLLTHPELFRILSGISQSHHWAADHILRKKVIGRLDYYPFEYWTEWAGRIDPEVLNHHLKFRSKTGGFSGDQVVQMLEGGLEIENYNKAHSEKPLLDLRDLLKAHDKRNAVKSEWTATDLMEMRVSPKLAFAINLISKAREMTHHEREMTKKLLGDIIAKTNFHDLCEKPAKKKHMAFPKSRGVFADKVRRLGFELLDRVPHQAQGQMMEFPEDLIDSSDEEIYQDERQYPSQGQTQAPCKTRGKTGYQKF